MSAASRRSSIVSKSGTTESSIAASSARSRAERTSAGEPVPDTISVSSACAAVPIAGARNCMERLPRAIFRLGELPGVKADVQLGEVEAKELQPSPKGGQPSISDPACPVPPKTRIDDLEVSSELVRPSRSRVRRLARAH